MLDKNLNYEKLDGHMAKMRKKELLEKRLKLQETLPHLYGWSWYPWAWDFFKSTNRQNYLCAANQISKSSTQIRKAIDWATDKSKWVSLWRRNPNQFWYLYPSKEVATVEWKTKWLPEFMPKDKDDLVYGWKENYSNNGMINAVHFKSGVSLYFKTYGQNVSNLQTGTVYAIFCDEELPVELYPELQKRLASTDGYWHMVFTATLGQEFWREVIEEKGKRERFPNAFKRQVSMFDCMRYKDGTASFWTKEKIQREIALCSTEAEVQRRVYGKFIVDSNLAYPSFSTQVNIMEPRTIPKDWLIYTGVDVGSGISTSSTTKKSHPAAIIFVAVNSNYREGWIFKGWRGDNVSTTATDILIKHQVMKGSHKPVSQFYDWASKDFKTIAERNGEVFLPADKSRESGQMLLNTLFKNGMLKIFRDDELYKLVNELLSLKSDTLKNNAKDDFVDALRYAVTNIPWDFSFIKMKEEVQGKKETKKEIEIRQRKGIYTEEESLSFENAIENEINEINDLLGVE